MVFNDYHGWDGNKKFRLFDRPRNVSYILSGRGYFLIFPASTILTRFHLTPSHAQNLTHPRQLWLIKFTESNDPQWKGLCDERCSMSASCG